MCALIGGTRIKEAFCPFCPSSLLCAAVIKTFGAQIGAEQKQVQGLIRLAKKNGEKLGFLS